MSAVTMSAETTPHHRPPGFTVTRWDVWAWLVPLAAMSPMLLFQWQNLMSRSERQFFPLLVVAALFFPIRAMMQEKGSAGAKPISLGRARAAVTLLVLAVSIYAGSVLLFSPWLSHVAAIVLFLAWGLGRCSQVQWPTVLAWTGLLAVTLPLPLGYDLTFIAWLQTTSSWACSMALDAFGILHLRTANVIEVRGRQLFVEEACSGIGSMYALLAAAALLVLTNRRSMLVALITLASVPIWSMLGNFFRLLAIALAQDIYNRDLSHGTDHELLGFLTFALSALGLWMTEWVMAGMLQPIPPTAPEFAFLFRPLNFLLSWPGKDPFASLVDTEVETPAERVERERAEAAAAAAREAAITRVRPWDVKALRLIARSAAALALVAGVAPAMLVAQGDPNDLLAVGLPEFSEQERQSLPTADSMPSKLGSQPDREWTKTGYHTIERSTASLFGAHSHVWEYRRGEERFLLSMDFPFRGSHPLQVCYTNSGWTIDRIEKLQYSSSDDTWPWTQFLLSDEFGSRAFVCFSLLTEEGKPYLNEAQSLLTNRANRGIAIARALASPESAAEPLCYQVQVLCESGVALSEQEQQDIRDCFLQARSSMLDHVRNAYNAR